MTEKLSITSKLTLDFQASISYEKFVSDYKAVIDTFNKENTYFQKDGSPFPDYYLQLLTGFRTIFGLQYQSDDESSFKMTYLEFLLFRIYQRLFYGGLDTSKVICSGRLLSSVITETYSTDYKFAEWELEDIKSELEKEGKISVINVAYLCYIKSYWLKKIQHEKMKIFQHDREGAGLTNEMIKLDRSIGYRLRKIKYEVEFARVHYIEYIAFCVLFLTKELCFVYEHHPIEFAKIIDKKDIEHYIDKGCYTFNVSKLIQEEFSSFAGETYSEKRKKKQSRDKLIADMKSTAHTIKDVNVAIDISDSHPKFMTANRKNTDPNQYHAIDTYVGDYGEVTKVKNKVKGATLKAKKNFKYE